MADNVQSMMLDILKRIQADVADVKGRVAGLEDRMMGIEGRMVVIEGRLERVETATRKQSRDSAAMLVMMRGVVGAFDERVVRLEDEVRLIREQE